MIDNPAKKTYMKFDLAADFMERESKPVESKTSKSKGLLQRFNSKKSKDETSVEDEPIDIAMRYFVAIRNERRAINKNKQDS